MMLLVLLTNVYAANNRWGEMDFIQKKMRDEGVLKAPGCSSIEAKGWSMSSHLKTSHTLGSEGIYSTLEEIMRKVKLKGDIPSTSGL
ncbi:hypothetical protein AMTR_s00142p00034860 [Amborella trichopoda]|uniref:Uncharacterized protein n=1 Tax=Amborella trichopoda TaxID=13333 RepID=W1PE88_AMBTC|nr:hypothetical protein AMTR_s00142p00034860 [Amborella trichopoda]